MEMHNEGHIVLAVAVGPSVAGHIAELVVEHIADAGPAAGKLKVGNLQMEW